MQNNNLNECLNIWIVPLDQEMNSIYEMLEHLPKNEKIKIIEKNNIKEKEAKIKTKFALNTIINKYINKSHSKKLKFFTNSFGKPTLQSKENISFNLTYSEDLALIAITKKDPVGIDIEKCIYNSYHYEIAKQFFTNNEANYLANNIDEITKRFYQIWTRKEAFLKAIGTGLGNSLKAYDVIFPSKNKNNFVFEIKNDFQRKSSYLVSNAEINKGTCTYMYAVSYCHNAISKTILEHFFDWEKELKNYPNLNINTNDI